MHGPENISQYPLTETVALVVCGGKSSRMGTDKSMLRYYEKPQRYHVYDLLTSFCKEVRISCNAGQADTIEDGYFYIADEKKYADTGPMTALLTAADAFPNKNILFIGCDYPLLHADDLKSFIEKCSGQQPVAFYNEITDLFEPLLAWYPHSLFNQLKRNYEKQQYALQHFLRENNAVKFYPSNKTSIISIDTQEAFLQILHALKQR